MAAARLYLMLLYYYFGAKVGNAEVHAPEDKKATKGENHYRHQLSDMLCAKER